jgi:antitoxin (DNA-binding transcriptional repressor) of toxin-antitoxin stability system
MATKISKAAAVAELGYRNLAKPRPARKGHKLFVRISAVQRTLALNASGDDLRAAAGVEVIVKGKTVARITTGSSREDALLKVKAQAAFKRAHAKAEPGQKNKAGRAAYKAVFVKAAEKQAA